MEEKNSFEMFKTGFTKEGEFYIPKDQSHNIYRHFGLKSGNKLLLDRDELWYIFSRLPPAGSSLRTKAYFELKNSDLNILRICKEEENLSNIFIRTKHFCRNREIPVAGLKYVGKDEFIAMVKSETVVGILGRDAYCFIKLQPCLKLGMSTPDGLWKGSRKGNVS